MAKPVREYVCQQCGAVHPKWTGRCDSCGAWNSLIEETREAGPAKSLAAGRKGKGIAFTGLDGGEAAPPRAKTGVQELDRVCGGGLVAGSVLLVGGDPGIGKSTLLLQAAAAMSRRARCYYISGEEAVDQVRLRAKRLGLADCPVQLAAATNLRDIIAGLDHAEAPDLVIIDSIQTMYMDTLDSAPGTVAQVRASAQELIKVAKKRGFALFLVGHVTKEGAIAGPRVLEHMVDTVLYFEGERGHQFRILRAVKNRFGPTDEIGVFEMTDAGLSEVANPSALFLAERRGNVSGACVFAGIEGSRPLLVEIQALVAPSGLSSPRRAVVGWDSGRLAMVLAVLDTRCGMTLSGNDIYLNVAGGLRISEPAADLAVAAALVSGASNVPAPPDMVAFGEIGLSGEVRAVGQTESRLKEAAKLGFSEALAPRRMGTGGKSAKPSDPGLKLREIGHLQDLVALFQSGAKDAAPRAGGTRHV